MKSQRVLKVESLVQKIAAETIRREMGPDSATVTVTSADVTPDLKHAVLWIGLIAYPDKTEKLFQRVLGLRGAVQYVLAKELQTKYAPRVEFRHDTTGEYVQNIDELLKKN